MNAYWSRGFRLNGGHENSTNANWAVSLFAPLGCAMSGLIADSRTMVEKARVEAQVGGVYLRRVDLVQRGRSLMGCYHTELLVHIQ